MAYQPDAILTQSNQVEKNGKKEGKFDLLIELMNRYVFRAINNIVVIFLRERTNPCLLEVPSKMYLVEIM